MRRGGERKRGIYKKKEQKRGDKENNKSRKEER